MCCDEKRRSGLPSIPSIVLFFRSLSTYTGCSEHLGDRQAGDGHPLASRRVSPGGDGSRTLTVTDRSPARHPPIDPRPEPRQPALMRSADRWPTPQTRHRCGSNLGRRYMASHRRSPSQRRKTFLRNHADEIAVMNLFVGPHIQRSDLISDRTGHRTVNPRRHHFHRLHQVPHRLKALCLKASI